VEPHPAIEAEVVHAVRRELAQRVEDVLVRRFHLYYEHPDQGVSVARRVAELMGEELGWDPEQVRAEAERYLEFVNRQLGPGALLNDHNSSHPGRG
jgi:glycerol-3-phosphate dehydrogenase